MIFLFVYSDNSIKCKGDPKPYPIYSCIVNTTVRERQDIVEISAISIIVKEREYARILFIQGHCPGNSPKPCLRWDTPNAEFQHMFDYVKDGYNKPVAIKVLSPGIYTVYAQLAISGPDTRYIECWLLSIPVGFLNYSITN